MKKKIAGYVMIACLLATALVAAGCISSSSSADDAKASINDTLIGTNLTYYSIAGVPMNYTITSGDIVSIEPVTFDGRSAWKVRVGQSLAWDLTMDVSGTKVLNSEQLFQT